MVLEDGGLPRRFYAGMIGDDLKAFKGIPQEQGYREHGGQVRQ